MPLQLRDARAGLTRDVLEFTGHRSVALRFLCVLCG